MLVGSISPPYSTCVHRTSSPPAELATPGTNGKYIFIHYFFKIEGFFILTCAGSSVFGCVRGPGGAGGGGLGGRWVVCRCAGRCRVRRLPAVVFRGLGCGLSPFWGFCVPIGLVWSYDIRSVRGYSIHPPSLYFDLPVRNTRSHRGPVFASAMMRHKMCTCRRSNLRRFF